MSDYKTLLPFLLQNREDFDTWDRNPVAQAAFYQRVMNETGLFERSDSEDYAKRGRTLTNGLTKLGFADSHRSLSEVGKHWLRGEIVPPDDLEQALGIDTENLVFFRQCMKLRVFDQNGYFYPFRIALQLLVACGGKAVSERDFLTFLHSIEPKPDRSLKEEIASFVVNVAGSSSNEIVVPSLLPESKSPVEVVTLFEQHPLNRGLFNSFFTNRKTSKSQDDYYKFVSALLEFKKKPTLEMMNRVLELSRLSAVKKAFGYGRIAFQSAKTLDEFSVKNRDNALLDTDNSLIYRVFLASKQYDLVREYSDMTKRIFNLTGVFEFSNGLVSLVSPDIIGAAFPELELSAIAKSDEYENDLKSDFYRDMSIVQTLEYGPDVVALRKAKLEELFGSTNLGVAAKNIRNTRFKEFVDREFPSSKVETILPLFVSRNDSQIQKLVTDNADVPTIFEYMLAITWYYISGKQFSVLESMNLTLDGGFLPLTHAAGGDGDIVIQMATEVVMLEATLMNKNAQKRGELEPVIRHSTNLAVREAGRRAVYTVFVADELDDNVINIFRASRFIELTATNVKASVQGVSIFALSVTELLRMLQFRIDAARLMRYIDEEYSNGPALIQTGWRQNIIDKLLPTS